jgi:hypothetical protein
VLYRDNQHLKEAAISFREGLKVYEELLQNNPDTYQLDLAACGGSNWFAALPAAYSPS